MAENKNALVQYEAGVISFPMQALTDLGDNKSFTSTAAIFSQDSSNAPVIRPNGIINGGKATPNVGNNSVTVATLLANLNGVETTVVGANVTVTRPATNVAKVISITVDSTGAFAVVAGTDGTNTTFSEIRGAAAAPPFIPVDSIEVCQVRLSSSANAAITSTQIFQVDGTHKEVADFPLYVTDDGNGDVVFSTALPLIHTGSKAKAVYASFAEPVFQDQPIANTFVPAELSVSVSSTQWYGGARGASSESLSAASFTAVLKDGIGDPILSRVGKKLWFRFYQDRTRPSHILTQGTLSQTRTFDAAGEPQATFTIAASTPSINKTS
jgi:hypothetical protein